MKVIIAGSRSIDNYDAVEFVMNNMNLGNDIQVVSGGAKGVDLLGEKWAYENNFDVIQFLPIWTRPDGSLDKAAGFKRNAAMGQYAEAAVVFWDGSSKGSEHMIKVMKDLKKPVAIVYITEDGDIELEGDDLDE